MNDTIVTFVGNVATDVRHTNTDRGSRASFRLASTPRRFDTKSESWVDDETTWLTVVCWRGLASNVLSSLARGDAVIVKGRLRTRTWDLRDGSGKGSTIEVEADVVGHDLTRGTSAFRRIRQEGPTGRGTQPPAEAGDGEGLDRDAVPEDGGGDVDADQGYGDAVGARLDAVDAA